MASGPTSLETNINFYILYWLNSERLSAGLYRYLPEQSGCLKLKVTSIVASIIAISFLMQSGSALVSAVDQFHDSSKDRLVISFSSASTADAIRELAASCGSTVEITAQAGLAFWKDWDNGILDTLRATQGVNGVEIERHSKISFTPNDPYYSTYQWGEQRINANTAWDFTLGSHNVTVAVLDTGIDYTHDDLSPNMWKDAGGHFGYDFWNGDSDPMDDNIDGYENGVWMPNLYIYHGTHVAGVVGADTNNLIGIAGTAQCKLMAVKVMNESGEGTDATVAQGMIWAVDHGAQIITMSLGVDSQTLALTNAVQYASAHGVVLVAAAGNEGVSSISYPAAYPEVISVGATDRLDHRASFSNYGSRLEVMAPGVQIWSTKVGDTYQELSGTSTATPFVAGVAALMLSINPALSRTQISTVLNQTADDIGSVGWDSVTGWGIVDAHAAVQAVSGPAATIINSPATATPNSTLTIEWVVSGSGNLPIDHTFLKWGYSATQLSHTSGLTYGFTTPHTFNASDVVAPNVENSTLYLQAVAVINNTQYLSTIVEIKVQSGSSDPFQNLIQSIKNFIYNDVGLLNFILIIFVIVVIAIIFAVVRRGRRTAAARSINSASLILPSSTSSHPADGPTIPPNYPSQVSPPLETPVVYVDISNGAVSPAVIEIYEGTRVIWRNRDWAPPPGISIVSGMIDAAGLHPDGIFSSGMMVSPGEYWSAIFNVAGAYSYYISNLNMNGRVIVRRRA
jgi:subtilisin family serine protease/plastocyanin